jgi:hypothetical protein
MILAMVGIGPARKGKSTMIQNWQVIQNVAARVKVLRQMAQSMKAYNFTKTAKAMEREARMWESIIRELGNSCELI